MNYHSKKREIKNLKKRAKKERSKRHDGSSQSSTPGTSTHPDEESDIIDSTQPSDNEPLESNDDTNIDEEDNDDPGNVRKSATGSMEEKCWAKPTTVEDKTREEEFDDYLADLLL